MLRSILSYVLLALGVQLATDNCSANETQAPSYEALKPFVELSLPDGVGPFPLASLQPGCLGWHNHHDQWRERLLAAGFAVLHVDSFTARGVTDKATLEREVCSGLRIRGSDRAGDLFIVLQQVWQRAEIDADHTVLFGWSHGAWSTMDFILMAYDSHPISMSESLRAFDLNRINASFLYYPYCGIGSQSLDNGYPSHVKTLVFHGDRDVITNPRECRARADELKNMGADIAFYSMKGAGHWFDNSAQRTLYDAGATARSQALIDEVLEQLLNN